MHDGLSKAEFGNYDDGIRYRLLESGMTDEEIFELYAEVVPEEISKVRENNRRNEVYRSITSVYGLNCLVMNKISRMSPEERKTRLVLARLAE